MRARDSGKRNALEHQLHSLTSSNWQNMSLRKVTTSNGVRFPDMVVKPTISAKRVIVSNNIRGNAVVLCRIRSSHQLPANRIPTFSWRSLIGVSLARNLFAMLGGSMFVRSSSFDMSRKVIENTCCPWTSVPDSDIKHGNLLPSCAHNQIRTWYKEGLLVFIPRNTLGHQEDSVVWTETKLCH